MLELWVDARVQYHKSCVLPKVRGSQRYVKALDSDDPDKIFLTEVSTVQLDDSQYVMFKLESGNYLRF